jgi:hypothetical protein
VTVRRAVAHPVAPAVVVLCASAAALAALPGWSPVGVVLSWTLLGVSAGYSISGSA